MLGSMCHHMKNNIKLKKILKTRQNPCKNKIKNK